MGHVEEAQAQFTKALSVSPRTPVQKELGWINLENDRLPTAISLLNDHLQRNASDYEAYNLLLKCYYLTDRFEIGAQLAHTLMEQNPPNDCFFSNFVLCLWAGSADSSKVSTIAEQVPGSPFIEYNRKVATEAVPSWIREGKPTLKSKLLFQEYQFRHAPRRPAKPNTLVAETPDGSRHEFKQPIVSIGSLATNDIVIADGSVSRRHCVIVNYPGDVWLYDLESSLGTVVGGQRIARRVLLDEVQEIEVGRVRVRITPSRGRLFGT